MDWLGKAEHQGVGRAGFLGEGRLAGAWGGKGCNREAWQAGRRDTACYKPLGKEEL